jgi:peptidoglycan/xylan/chitin deacetylase (PgdA/CDA1 family)
MNSPSKKIYLTIDDSPSKDTDGLIDFLTSKNIPAMLFARGAFMEEKDSFERIVRAIKNGFIISNHSYEHERTSEIGFRNQTNQILKTQKLIDTAYEEAGIQKPPRYFRFPHLDRGCGNAWIIDFETVPNEYRHYVQSLFWDGVRLENKDIPTPAQIQCKKDIQNWLIDNDFQKFSPADVTFPWWVKSELGQAIDVLITYSTSDWMATPRHLGKWPYKNTDDLCQKINDDPFLLTSPSSHIILMHDDREESLTITKKLIMHFLNQNFSFLPVTGVSR